MATTAKKAAKKTAPAKAASGPEAERAGLLKQAEQIPIKYDAVMTALSKADAARVLFVQVMDGSVFGEEAAGWIGMFSEEAFAEALGGRESRLRQGGGRRHSGEPEGGER